ncbi:hypothetical protein TNCV_1598301 [Trichonephila clavipes]|nr:hypothetical protein TNCV_1598301 [Trichonephila clavipes]
MISSLDLNESDTECEHLPESDEHDSDSDAYLSICDKEMEQKCNACGKVNKLSSRENPAPCPSAGQLMLAYSVITGHIGRLRPSIPYLEIYVVPPLKFSCWEKNVSDWLCQSFGKIPVFLSFSGTWEGAKLSDWIMACEENDPHWLFKCLAVTPKCLGGPPVDRDRGRSRLGDR